MNEKQTAWLYRLGLLFTIAFVLSAASFLRPSLYGTDSYSAALCIQGQECDRLPMQPLAIALYHVLPSFPVVINIVMLLFLFFALIPIFLLVKREFDERTAWISVFLLSAASPLLTFAFHNFGNEVFAYPFLFWALYFLSGKKDWFTIVLGCGALFIAGEFWAISAYYLVPLIFFFPALLGVLVYVIVLYGSSFFGYLWGLDQRIIEWRIGAGLVDLFFLVLVVPFATFWNKKHAWVFSFLTFFGLVILQGRLAPLLLPFMALGIGQAMRVLAKTKISLKIVCIMAVFLIICWQVAFFNATPSAQEVGFAHDFVQLANKSDINAYNDWSYGYLIEYQGLYTEYKGSFPNPDYNNLPHPYLALTNSYLDCNIVKEEKATYQHTAIYSCT